MYKYINTCTSVYGGICKCIKHLYNITHSYYFFHDILTARYLLFSSKHDHVTVHYHESISY